MAFTIDLEVACRLGSTSRLLYNDISMNCGLIPEPAVFTMNSYHWDDYAPIWQFVQAPLKPSAADIAIYQALVEQSLQNINRPTVLVLGVTQAILELQWPEACTIFAAEKSLPTILACKIKRNATSVCCDWLSLPLPDGSVDLVIGDGSYNVIGAGTNYGPLNKELHRVLRNNGSHLFRYFTQTDKQETIATIEGRTHQSFHIFKFRLAMSMQKDFFSGVALNSIWQEWLRIKSSTRFSPRLKEGEEKTIAIYRNSSETYNFPKLYELKQALKTSFYITKIVQPNYPFGERCPIVYSQKINPCTSP